MNYSEALAYLYGLQKFGIKLGLHTIKRLLSSIGDPHKQFPSIHIAGTNGKGSTAAFLASVLTKAGYTTGLYTSPHLLSFNERIRIGDRTISKEDVVRITTVLQKKSRGFATITYFEMVTAMAFLYFAERNVDCAVLEVGMGGRLDATNVVVPLISIITTISKEHEFYLGPTLRHIVQEKAGIIKRKRPVVTGVTQPALIKFLKENCRIKHSRLYRLGKDFTLEQTSSHTSTYHGMTFNLKGISLGLRGEFQATNAALALAALDILKADSFQIDTNSMLQGLREVYWPGRLEIVMHTPLVILDGAHNPDAMNNLMKSILNDFRFKRFFLVLGIMEDKNIKKMIGNIVKHADQIILSRPRMDRAATTQDLSEILETFNLRNFNVIEDVAKAALFALTRARKDDLICVTGSLFTVAEAHRLFKQKNFDNN
jgi:dihydrofolate synthase/folylpolyglutamate synthase